MTTTNPKTFEERAKEAELAFALSVALDPQSTPDDVRAAQRMLLKPSDERAVQSIEAAWQLAIIAAVLDPSDPLHYTLRNLVTPHPAPQDTPGE